MKTIKRFIVWVNYGLEGWSIFGSSDDWDEAVSIRSEAIDECNIDEEDIILAENKKRAGGKTCGQANDGVAPGTGSRPYDLG
ncbi:hypothetical protein HT118_02790 [Escherichia coli]|nr:hypothetical protein [Escherichia coli]